MPTEPEEWCYEIARHMVQYPAAYKTKAQYRRFRVPAVFAIVVRHWERRQIIAAALRRTLSKHDAQRAFEKVIPRLEKHTIAQVARALHDRALQAELKDELYTDIHRAYELAEARVCANFFSGIAELGGEGALEDLGFDPTRAVKDAFRQAGVLKGRRGRPPGIRDPLSRRSLKAKESP